MAHHQMQLEYSGRADGTALQFTSGHWQQHSLTLRNVSDDSMLFKVRCTAPRNFRVRPALGMVAPGASVVIHIHLAPQAKSLDTCAFLVLGRVAPVLNNSASESQLKTLWTVMENDASRSSTLVLSEKVPARICHDDDGVIGSNTVTRSESADTSTTDTSRVLQRPAVTTTTPLTSPLTLQQRSEAVRLVMKSQSRRAENALLPHEDAQLAALRHAWPDDWPRWQLYASRLRALLRERQRRLQRTSTTT